MLPRSASRPPEGGARARVLPSRAGGVGRVSENPPPPLQLTQEARWPRVARGGGVLGVGRGWPGAAMGGHGRAGCPEEGCISSPPPELKPFSPRK